MRLSSLISWPPLAALLRAIANFMLRTTPIYLDTSPSSKESSTMDAPTYSLAFGRFAPVSSQTLNDAFALAVSKCPRNIALEHVDARITYEELDANAYCMAKALRSHDVKIRSGARVCLLAERGIPFITGIFAILKAGASYIPLDGNITTDHQLQFILQDASPTLLLCSRKFLSKASQFSNSVRVAVLEDLSYRAHNAPCGCKSFFVAQKCAPTDEAYVIYTSGTTGKPKGVSASHRGITNVICSSPANLGIAPGTRVGQILNIAFDMGAWEILACLLNGGTLVIRGSSSADEWHRVLRAVNVLISTPSILSKYNPLDFPNMRTVATGGEPCSPQLADKWSARCQFFNCCGPTEVTILNTMHEHVTGGRVSIGKPTPNNSVYVLDENDLPVPLGVPGTLWAGGIGISKGYVNLPSLTSCRFRKDPYSSISSVMYNTGDFGVMNLDGTLSHLGRVDDQVKIKGFRVELDGVAAVISSCPGVAMSCAVIVSGNTLCGFYSPSSISKEIVKSKVAQRLPYYANPTRYIALDDFPLTINGKIDKRALKNVVESHLAHFE